MDGWTAFLSSLSSDKHMICATVRLYSVKQLEEFRPGLAGPESAHTHTHTHTHRPLMWPLLPARGRPEPHMASV